jgi:AraC family transcriptional regulator
MFRTSLACFNGMARFQTDIHVELRTHIDPLSCHFSNGLNVIYGGEINGRYQNEIRENVYAMRENAQITIDAQFSVPAATVQVARFSVFEACECNVTQSSGYQLIYFSRRPANAIARVVDRWKPNRFERLGDLFLLPEGEALLARGDAGEASVICLQFHRDLIQTLFHDKLEWTDHELAACLDIRSGILRELMCRLADEATSPGFGSEALVEAMSMQIAIELARHCQGFNVKPVRGGIEPWRLRRIDERLTDNPTPPSIGELARLCNLSERQLARTFRASFGMSIGNYIAHNRIEYAKRLLRSEKGIKAIAHEMGFKSTSGFCFSFRRATGQTPGRFRDEMRQRDVLSNVPILAFEALKNTH